jgi:hypothetical protein
VRHEQLRMAVMGHPSVCRTVQLVLGLGTEGSFKSDLYRTAIKRAVKHGHEQVGNKDDRYSRMISNHVRIQWYS